MNKIVRLVTLVTAAGFLFCAAKITPANAEGVPPSKKLINETILKNIHEFIDTDIVRMSIKNQNIRFGTMSDDKIQELDKQWRAETKSDDQPIISATLSNPLSTYLTRIQAHSLGLYSEMFVMDKNGLNVGQSNISSDYWQGDEAKFQKTFPLGADAIFIDDPEYDEDLGIWRAQVNLSISDSDNKTVIGAITVEINMSELERRYILRNL